MWAGLHLDVEIATFKPVFNNFNINLVILTVAGSSERPAGGCERLAGGKSVKEVACEKTA